MNNRLSRRNFVISVGAVVSGAAAKAAGLLPETALAAQVAPPAGVLTSKDIKIRDFSGEDLGRAFSTWRAAGEGRALWSESRRRGLDLDLSAARGTWAHARPHAPEEGFVVMIPLAGRGDVAGRLIFGMDVRGKAKSVLTTWSVDRPDVVSVYGAPAGERPQKRSTVTFVNDAAFVDYPDGSRKVVRARPSSGKGPGLAAPLADCGLNGIWCNIACDLAVGLACTIESAVVCVGVSALCPPCGAVCTAISFVVCTVTTTVSCYYVCQPC